MRWADNIAGKMRPARALAPLRHRLSAVRPLRPPCPHSRSRTSGPQSIFANPQQSIFANTNLNLEYIKAYGFDYDYTLSDYTPELQTLIYELASKHMVESLAYPAAIADRSYDADFSIRGLHYDKVRRLW